MNPRPILDLIIANESESAAPMQRAASAYDVVWGGIKRADYPSRPLTQMTVAEVLAWQDSIDRRYDSEAAGAFQIMEDTLRTLHSLPPAAMFDQAGQDRLCLGLLDRRGWSRLCTGEITPERFADNLAREWASFPVQSDQKGASRQIKRGQSYYAGDGLNKAHTTPEQVMEAIRVALELEETRSGLTAGEIAVFRHTAEAMKTFPRDAWAQISAWAETAPREMFE